MRLFLFLIIPLIISGCAGMNSQFPCPSPKKDICKSLKEVNRMVEEGTLEKSTKQKIWIAPYKDKYGNYYQSSYVYTTI